MANIAFIDIEFEPKSRTIVDVGGVKDNGNYFIRIRLLTLLSS